MVCHCRRPGCRVRACLEPGDRAFRSVNALGWSSKEAASTRRWPARYAAYVGAMHEWAGSLGVTAAWLEWLMFDLNGHVEAQ
ncbi:8-oxoguanine DNA glycosylase OGG fold protein [Streptomyces mirabilis]|uniref:8-oxoguanine DNA glycosylase OGG fold protein n=1 Tax=Streptomyces mirabilis TaxID=68239 RepID=UPI0036CD0038